MPSSGNGSAVPQPGGVRQHGTLQEMQDTRRWRRGSRRLSWPPFVSQQVKPKRATRELARLFVVDTRRGGTALRPDAGAAQYDATYGSGTDYSMMSIFSVRDVRATSQQADRRRPPTVAPPPALRLSRKPKTRWCAGCSQRCAVHQERGVIVIFGVGFSLPLRCRSARKQHRPEDAHIAEALVEVHQQRFCQSPLSRLWLSFSAAFIKSRPRFSCQRAFVQFASCGDSRQHGTCRAASPS